MIADATMVRTDAGTTPHPSVVALRAVGLLGPTELLRAEPADLSRAHGVWAVHLPDDRRVVVKSGALTAPDTGSTGAAQEGLGAELFVQRMARWCLPLQAAIPSSAAVDEEHGILVVEDLGAGHPASLALVSDTIGDPDAFFRLLGARMGAVHRATAGLPLPPARPPLVLHVLRPGEHTDAATVGLDLGLDLAEATRALVALLRAQPALMAAAARLRTPAGRALVHHDLKWDNVAVAAGPSPVLVDWELAGAGDPAWDLGCLVAEHLLRDASTAVGLPSPGRALVRGYGEAARISSRAAGLFAERVALASVLRLAQFALEVAERSERGDEEQAHGLVALAIARQDHLAVLTEELRSCLAR